MRTVKQVSDLSGISVRMLHYYDEIGLLKPSEVTDAGYRLYDDEALMFLQQILFYKEFDIPLKEVKKIMHCSDYDKAKALENQKKLLILKSNRINNLIDLIDKTLKGEKEVSFNEFDMSEYFKALEAFKMEYKDKIIKNYSGMEKYDELIEKCKLNENEIAEMAIKQYGSIENYVEAMKKNFESDMFSVAEQIDAFKKDILDDKHPKLKELYQKLVSDITKDPLSKEIQQIAEKIKNIIKSDYEVFRTDEENQYWYTIIQLYLVLPDWIDAVDNKYGKGTSKFIGEALKTNLGNAQPKLNSLYAKLTESFNKDPSSKEIQDIVEEIVKETTRQHEKLKIEVGENYWGYTADLYRSNSAFQIAADKKYGDGAARFIGAALNYYATQEALK
ncbi:MerR family transcriptional regulator [Lacrimispora amygdalina]|uniref:MerR family transcriptional regulator n=1 Tax=Lacrimispora amygdalina TaxID=253257 RepID=UPI000BE249DB|nr:MerR family transcriptional regulator [Lacrimispora amygdalina]